MSLVIGVWNALIGAASSSARIVLGPWVTESGVNPSVNWVTQTGENWEAE